MTNVIKFQSPFERIKQYSTSPEVMLCKAILTQAIIDATNTSNEKEPKRLEIEAKTWLFSGDENFNRICLGADMEPSFVVKITRQLIKLHKNQVDGREKNSKKLAILDSQELQFKFEC